MTAPRARSAGWIAVLVVAGLGVGCAATGTSTDHSGEGGPSQQQQAASPEADSPEDEQKDLEPFTAVVPESAETDAGLITVHRTDEALYFEIPDSLMGREILSVSRVAKTQADLLGRFGGGGKKVIDQVLRWERRGEKLLRAASHEKTADPGEEPFGRRLDVRPGRHPLLDGPVGGVREPKREGPACPRPALRGNCRGRHPHLPQHPAFLPGPVLCADRRGEPRGPRPDLRLRRHGPGPPAGRRPRGGPHPRPTAQTGPPAMRCRWTRCAPRSGRASTARAR
jgi:hypothetical protein